MLQISGLTKSYGTRLILESTGFSMQKGERLGIVGRNGSGKTTLMRLIQSEDRPEEGTISMVTGTTIGRVDQHINISEDTVLDEACLALPHAEDHRDESYRAKQILAGLGFTPEMLEMHPSELSGGYQVRLALSKALVSEPDLLLLDEPTNYLDIVSIRWLREFLRSWRGGLLLITHDRDFMDSVCTATVAIHRRKLIRVDGPTQALYSHIIQEEEHYEKVRISDDKKRKEIETFINRFRAQARRANVVQSRVKAMSKKISLKKLEKDRELEFRFTDHPFVGKFKIEAENLKFAYSNSEEIIKGLSFLVAPRDRIAIIGKNGAGKTTLLNLLAGELKINSGKLRINPKTKLGYFGQTNVNRLSPGKTIEEEIMDVSREIGQNAARNIAGAMLFEGDEALKKISVLSGGERSRVLLGKLLVSPANLLLLDEPTNHLDMQSVDSLLEAVEAFSGAAIMVTHSEMILRSFAQRLIIFDGGTVSMFEGTYDDFLERRGWCEEKGSCPTTKIETRPSNNKKNIRRQRAAIMQARSEALTPLKNKIEKLEEDIMALEARTEEINLSLIEASQSGDSEAIQKLSKELHEANTNSDKLYTELDSTHTEHDRLEAEYSNKLE
jgi:ATP-binding cassette subfamily F protein 3